MPICKNWVAFQLENSKRTTKSQRLKVSLRSYFVQLGVLVTLWFKTFLHIGTLQIFKLLFMWKEENNKLYKKFTFKNFSEAFAFMTRVAIEAEKMDHHPTWTNTWNAVEISLNTHSAGNTVTEKDRELAKKIDTLLS